MESELHAEWREKYGEAVDSDFTVVCEHCGTQIGGDSPEIVIECWTCYKQLNGVAGA